jgi:hypothetical protein
VDLSRVTEVSELKINCVAILQRSDYLVMNIQLKSSSLYIV